MAAASRSFVVEREEGQVSGLDGTVELDAEAVRTADEDEIMSRAVILGRASDPLPRQVRVVLDEQRRRREDGGDAEEGWVNADEEHLWPVERASSELEDDWIDAEADEPGTNLS